MCYKALGFHEQLLGLVDHIAHRRVSDAKASRRSVVEIRDLAKERFEDKKAKGEVDSEHPFNLSEHLDQNEAKEFFKHRSLTTVSTYYLDFLKGFALSAQGDQEQAIVSLRRAIDAEPNRTSLHVSLGEVFLKMRKREEAKAAFEKALEIDDNNVAALVGIAKFYNAVKDYESAVEYSLLAVNRMYEMPIAHYTLGYALMKMGRYQKAMTAFEVATSQNPNFGIAYRHMAYICLNHIKAAERLFFVILQKNAELLPGPTKKNWSVCPIKRTSRLK